MITQVVGMGLTFLLAWMGRDKVWTPTFDGTHDQRYAQAVVHYQERMGLGDDFIVEVRSERRIVNGESVCAWVERSAEWRVDMIGVSTDKTCRKRFKPEFLALHEQCHRRMAHLDMPDLVNKHAEVKTCVGWYSAKERR